jgi:hypothetical protein
MDAATSGCQAARHDTTQLHAFAQVERLKIGHAVVKP